MAENIRYLLIGIMTDRLSFLTLVLRLSLMFGQHILVHLTDKHFRYRPLLPPVAGLQKDTMPTTTTTAGTTDAATAVPLIIIITERLTPDATARE